MALPAERWGEVSALFAELLDLPLAERTARLAALAHDAPLHAELRSLLASADSVGDRFEQAAAMPATTPDAPRIGRRIGPYELVREIGQGGMGTVYEGERVDGDFRKRVAIKLVSVVGHRTQATARFQRERQLLARLEHRNIAALVDGGVSEEGEPYFIMEYVEGEPIDRWCASRQLGLRERLALFRQVCAAVQYAHEHLVIHRDLKPGNIFVADDGTVKLLDFGIAKLADPTVAEAETLTQTGALPMTVAYASPEQLRGDEVTTASDIYSLGVVLYELLTGVRPFPAGSRGAALLDRGVPTAPSRAEPDGGESGSAPDTAARWRRTLAGDVDSIVLMALRPEAERRYRTAQQLADDLQRFLTGLPVLAQPDTLGYRVGKFARRNRVAVAAAALALIALVGGTAISLRQARVARAERDRAVLEQQRTAQVTQFFQDVLSTSKPQESGTGTTVLEAIDLVIPRIDSSFASAPDLRAAIKNTLASTLIDMGLYERARPLMVDAVRLHDSLGDRVTLRERADGLYNMAGLETEVGSPERAESLYRRSLTLYGQIPGIDSVELYQGMNNLANALSEQGRLEEAAELYAKVVDRLAVLRPDGGSAVALTNYATALATLGRYVEAEPRLREAAAIFTRTRGPEDMRVAGALQPLAGALLFQGKYAEADSVAERAIAIYTATLGPDNPGTLAAVRMRINILADAGRCREAIAPAEGIVALRGKGLAERDASLNTALLFLGWCQAELGDPVRGERTAREGLRLRRAAFPPTHWAVAQGESMLGDVLAKRGAAYRVEAERLLRSGYEGMARELDSTHVRVRQAKRRWERVRGGA
ncbi:MAG: serine/threonine-protein kinase [Gemmatimonadales bacterium]|nr:serine/threonine-protein kinase [Gemmatimonadales bacterium]